MSIACVFNRLTLQILKTRGLHATDVLCAEPLKKKKKLDPQIIKQREDRKKKKLEKQIRRLEKNARQLKPIEELEVPLGLLDESDKRTRNLLPLDATELEHRAELKNQWARFKHNEKVADYQIIDRLLQSQNKALQELRNESEQLYQEAIENDLQLLPVSTSGPVATPPIKDYKIPDGDYIHQSKNWEH